MLAKFGCMSMGRDKTSVAAALKGQHTLHGGSRDKRVVGQGAGWQLVWLQYLDCAACELPDLLHYLAGPVHARVVIIASHGRMHGRSAGESALANHTAGLRATAKQLACEGAGDWRRLLALNGLRLDLEQRILHRLQASMMQHMHAACICSWHSWPACAPDSSCEGSSLEVMMAARSLQPGMVSMTTILALVSALIFLTLAPPLPSTASTCA